MPILPSPTDPLGQVQVGPYRGERVSMQVGGEVLWPTCLIEHDLVHGP